MPEDLLRLIVGEKEKKCTYSIAWTRGGNWLEAAITQIKYTLG